RRRRSSFKKASQKNKSKEVKKEFDSVDLPQRNKALPLKHIIQGSKTVAAALVAALGSPKEARVDHDAAEGSSYHVSISNPAINGATTRTEGELQATPAVVVKKPRLASGNENTAEKISAVDKQIRRRLRSSSGRRKIASDATSSET
ncbi:unnamed protein product, partial [Strongylus vulgaris]